MRRLATIRKIDRIEEILGADNICLVHIDGWQCVAKKNEFKKDDLCIYFEIDSILPDKPCFDFMRPRKFRVKTIKCMKQLSQGLALPLSILSDFNLNPKDYQSRVSIGTDLTDVLDVKKHDPEAEKESFKRVVKEKPWYQKLLGKIPYLGKWLFKKKGATEYPSHIVSKTDEERFQNASNGMKECFVNTPFDVTEKVDGTSTTFIYKPGSFFTKETFMVCSRNFLKHIEDDSWWWTIARKADIYNKMKKLHSDMTLTKNTYLIMQGETIAPDIQKNKYKVKDYDFYLFNVKLVTGDITTEYSPSQIEDLKDLHKLDLKTVPLLAADVIVTSVEELNEYIKNRDFGIESRVNENVVAEGFVVRLQNQNVTKFKSFKFINPEFLLKHEE